MDDDYLAEVRRIYHDQITPRILLEERHVFQAGVLIERLFPPVDTHSAFRILVALNLLNAAVKTSWGRQLVTYSYIKGMVSRQFIHILRHPLPDIDIYVDRQEDLTFFRVMGVQLSFHHVPFCDAVWEELSVMEPERQEWDGMRLQTIAVELFQLANPDGELDEKRATARIRQQMCDFRRPFHEDKLLSLREALSFNIWDSKRFMLYRRKDHRPFRVIRYEGDNYQLLLDYLTDNHPEIPRRKRKTLEVGKFYYVSPQLRIRSLPLSNYIQSLTQNNYLIYGLDFCNLCVTYNIALYLSSLYSDLLFVNTLNYNHRLSQRRYYGYNQLLRVPVGAEDRRLKVWIVVDLWRTLRLFDVESLPQPLIDEYMASEDYYQEFEIIRYNGRKGIFAYRRYLLLPPVYPKIEIRNYHARVMREDGKWAIYALCEECFVSDFIYDRIWFDPVRYAILGEVEGQETCIYAFFP